MPKRYVSASKLEMDTPPDTILLSISTTRHASKVAQVTEAAKYTSKQAAGNQAGRVNR